MDSSKKIYVVLASDNVDFTFWNSAAYTDLNLALKHAQRCNALISDLSEVELNTTDQHRVYYDDHYDLNRSLEDVTKPVLKYYVQELELR